MKKIIVVLSLLAIVSITVFSQEEILVVKTIDEIKTLLESSLWYSDYFEKHLVFKKEHGVIATIVYNEEKDDYNVDILGDYNITEFDTENEDVGVLHLITIEDVTLFTLNINTEFYYPINTHIIQSLYKYRDDDKWFWVLKCKIYSGQGYYDNYLYSTNEAK